MSNPYAIKPIKVLNRYWSLRDANGSEIAFAMQNELTGKWTATLNPKQVDEIMNFVSVQAATATAAFDALFVENIKLAKSVVGVLEDMENFSDLRPMEDEEILACL